MCGVELPNNISYVTCKRFCTSFKVVAAETAVSGPVDCSALHRVQFTGKS
jgi:hypothetical protein